LSDLLFAYFLKRKAKKTSIAVSEKSKSCSQYAWNLLGAARAAPYGPEPWFLWARALVFMGQGLGF